MLLPLSGSQTEQGGDEASLADRIFFCQPPHSAFPDMDLYRSKMPAADFATEPGDIVGQTRFIERTLGLAA